MSLYDSLGETTFSINDPTLLKAPPFKYTRAIAYNGKYWLAGGTIVVRSVTIRSFLDVIAAENNAASQEGFEYAGGATYLTTPAKAVINSYLDQAKSLFASYKSLNYVPQPYTRRSVHCLAKSTDGLNWKYVEECPFVAYRYPASGNTDPGTDNILKINGLAWNGTKWMAVGRGSTYVNTNNTYIACTIATSEDGETWSRFNRAPATEVVYTQGFETSTISFTEVLSVTCDTSKWIIGTNIGVWKMNFTDSSWTRMATNIIGTSYSGVATNGTVIVAVGRWDEQTSWGSTDAAAIASSIDNGVTWTSRIKFISNDIYSQIRMRFKAVAWNGDKWIAVGRKQRFDQGGVGEYENTGVIAVSEDSIDWTITDGFSIGLSCVSWDGNEWFVGSTDGNVLISKDGFQWRTTDEDTSGTLTIATPIVLPILGGDLNIVNSIIVGSGNPTSVIRTYDDVNWINQVLTDDKKFFNNEAHKAFYGVTWSGTKWVIVGNRDVTGKSICVSTNGIDWTYPRTTLENGRDIAYGGGLYVAVGTSLSSTGKLVTSTDAETWTSRTCPLSGLTCVGYNGTKWVAGGPGGIIYSTDGLTWTKSVTCPLTTVNDVAWNGQYWVAVGKGSAHNVALSIDSIRWYIANDIVVPFLEGNSIAWNQTQWMAVGRGDQSVATSPDGYIWSFVKQSIIQSGNYVAWTGSKWLITGSGTSPVMTSTDAVTWTEYPLTLTQGNGFASKSVSLPITGTSGSYNTSLITNVVADLTQKTNATLAEEAAAAALAANQAAQAAALVKRNATKASADAYTTRLTYWKTTMNTQFEPLKNKTYADMYSLYPLEYSTADEIITVTNNTLASGSSLYGIIYDDSNPQTVLDDSLENFKWVVKTCEENVVTFYNLIRVLYKQLTNRTKLALTPTTMPDLLYNWGFSTTQTRDVVRGFYIIKANAISALSTSIQTTCDIPVTRVTYSDGTSTATNYKALYNSMFTFDLQNLPTTYKTDDSNAFYFLNLMNTIYTKMYPFKQQCDAIVASAVNESNKWATLAGETAPSSSTVQAAFSTVYTKYFRGISESLFVPTYQLTYGNLAFTDISVQAFNNVAATFSRPISYPSQLETLYNQARDKLNLVESNRSSALNYVKTKRQTTIKDKLVEFANTVKSDYSGPTLQIDIHAQKLAQTLLYTTSDYAYCSKLAKCLTAGAQLYPDLKDLLLAVPLADIGAEEDGIPRPEGGWGTNYKIYPTIEVDLVTVSNSRNVNLGASLLIGERITIPGASIPGGSTPANNIQLTVTNVDRNGRASNYTVSGTLPSNVTFTGVTGSRFVNSTVKLRVVPSGVGYTVQLISGQQGSGYSVGQVLSVPGTQLFRKSPTNDILATVTQTGTNGAVTAISVSGNSEISTVDDVPSYRNISASFTFLASIDKSPSQIDNFVVTLSQGGIKYALNDVIPFKGTEFGGKSPANDVSIVVDEVGTFGNIIKFHTVGTPATYKKYGVINGIDNNGILLSSKENETATFTIGEFTVVPTYLGFEKMIATSIEIKHKGSGYVAGDKILISGKNFPGGKSPLNDIAIKVITIGENGRIETFQVISQNFEFLVASKDVTTSILEQNATFNITRSYVSNPTYTVVLNSAGDGYVVGETITIPGENLGGKTPQNNVVVTVTGIGSAGAITSFTHTGTPVATLRVDTTPPDALIKLTAKSGASGWQKFIDTINTRSDLSNFLGQNSSELNGVRYMTLTNYDGIYGKLSLPDFLEFSNTETYDSISSKINTLNTKLTALIANDELSAEYIDTLVAADLVTIQSQVLPTATAYINGIISSVQKQKLPYAKFNVSWANDQYTVELVVGGLGYFVNQELTFLGTSFNGTTPANDLVLTILTVDETNPDEIGKILTFQRKSGTPAFSSSVTRAFDSVKSASFDVEIANRVYTVTLVNPGSGYTVNAELTFLGTGFGGTTPANDLVLKVLTVGTSGQILTFEKKSGTAIPTSFTGNTVVTNNINTNRFSSVAAAQATVEENYATLLNLPSTLTGKTNTQIVSILFNAGVTIVNAINNANGDYAAKIRAAVEYMRLYEKDKARILQTKDDLKRWIQMKKNALANSPFLTDTLSNGVGDPFIMSIPPTNTDYWIERKYPTYTLSADGTEIFECTLNQTTGKVVTSVSTPLDIANITQYSNTIEYTYGAYTKLNNKIYKCIKDAEADITDKTTTDEIKNIPPSDTKFWKQRRYPNVIVGNLEGEYTESLSTQLNINDYREYVPSKEYELGSIVQSGGAIYLCKNVVNSNETIKGIPPTNVSYWKEATYPTVTNPDGTSQEAVPSSFTPKYPEDLLEVADLTHVFRTDAFGKTERAFVSDDGYYREGPVTFQLYQDTEALKTAEYPPVYTYSTDGRRYQNYLMWELLVNPTSAVSTSATPYSHTTTYKRGAYVSYNTAQNGNGYFYDKDGNLRSNNSYIFKLIATYPTLSPSGSNAAVGALFPVKINASYGTTGVGSLPTSGVYWKQIGLSAIDYPLYSNSIIYTVGDIVKYTDPADGVMYVYELIQPDPKSYNTGVNTTPTNSVFWTKLRVLGPIYPEYSNTGVYSVNDKVKYPINDVYYDYVFQNNLPFAKKAVGIVPTKTPWQKLDTFSNTYSVYSNTETYVTNDIVTYTDPATEQTYNYKFVGTLPTYANNTTVYIFFGNVISPPLVGTQPAEPYWDKQELSSILPTYSNSTRYYLNDTIRYTDPADGNTYDYKARGLTQNGVLGVVPTDITAWEKIRLSPVIYPFYSNTTSYTVGNTVRYTDPADGQTYNYKAVNPTNKSGWAMRTYPAVYYNNVLTDVTTILPLVPDDFPAYSPDTEYSVGSMVSYTNKVYRHILAKPDRIVNVPVTNTNYWKRVQYNLITYDDNVIEAIPGAVPLLDSEDFDEYSPTESYFEGDAVKVTGTQTRFNLKGPMDVVTNQNGNIFIIDKGNNLIKEVLFNNEYPSVVNIGVQHYGYEFTQDGRVGSYNYDNPVLASKLLDGTTTTASYSDSLRAIAVDDATDTIYFSDSNRIRKITSNGTVTSYTTGSGYQDGAVADAKFSTQISGLIFDPDLNCLYVSDTLNHRIRKITSNGTVTTLAGSTAGFENGTGSSAKFNYPGGIDIDLNGNIYVADTGNHCIRKVTPLGVVTRIAGTVGTPGYSDELYSKFNSPYGIAVDTSGDVYVADTGNHCIRRISPSGDVITFAGTNEAGLVDDYADDARFNSPHGMSFDKFGNLFVADQGNNRIRKIRPDSRVLSSVKDQAFIYECTNTSIQSSAIKNISPTNTEYWKEVTYPSVYIDGVEYEANPTNKDIFKALNQYDYHRYDNNWMYKFGDRVAYNGKIYDCKNTEVVEESTHLVNVPPPNDLCWQRADAYESITSTLSSWFIGRLYIVGDMIVYLNKMYSCIESHTANATNIPTAAPRWIPYTTPQQSLMPEWSSIKPYSSEDIVLYRTKLYICILSHSANGNTPPDITSSIWKEYNPRTISVSNWEQSRSYKVGNLCRYNSFGLYICILAHTSTSLDVPTQTNKWKLSDPLTASSVIVWDLNIEYSVGTVVMYNGYFYRCEVSHFSRLIDSPAASRVNWSNVEDLSNVGLPDTYASTTLYSIGDMVTIRVKNAYPKYTQDQYTVEFYKCTKTSLDTPSEFTYDSIAILPSIDGNGYYRIARIPGTWNKYNVPRYGPADKDPFRVQGFAGKLRRKVWMDIEMPYRRLLYLNDYQYYLDYVPRDGETPPASYGSAYIASTFSSSSSTIATQRTDPTYGYTFNTFQSVLRPDDFAADQAYLTNELISIINDFKATKTGELDDANEKIKETMKIEDVILEAYDFVTQELEDAKTLPYEPKTEFIDTGGDENKCLDQLVFEINTMKMQYFNSPGVQIAIRANPYKFMSAVALAQNPPQKLFKDLGVGDIFEVTEYLKLRPNGGAEYSRPAIDFILAQDQILQSKLETISLRCYEQKLKLGFMIGTTMLASDNKMGARFECDSGRFDLPIADWNDRDQLVNFKQPPTNGLLEKAYALINASVSPPEYTLPSSQATRDLAVLTFEATDPFVKGLSAVAKGAVGLTVGLFEGATNVAGQMVNGIASMHASVLESQGKTIDEATQTVVSATSTNFVKFNQNDESIGILKQQVNYYRQSIIETENDISEDIAIDSLSRIGVMLYYLANYERVIHSVVKEKLVQIPPRVDVPGKPERVIIPMPDRPETKAMRELSDLKQMRAELVRKRIRYINILDGLSGRPPIPKFVADIPEFVSQTIEKTLNVDPPPNPYPDKIKQTRIRLAVQNTVIFENEAALRRLNNDLKSLIPDNGKYSRLAGSITSYTNGQLGGFLFDAGKNFPFTFAGQTYTLDSFLALSNESKISLGNNLRSSAASTAETIATTRTRISEITETLTESRQLRIGIRYRLTALQSLSSKYLQRWRAANPTQSILDYSVRELTGDELWDELDRQMKDHQLKVKEIQAERYILDVQESYYNKNLNLTEEELARVNKELSDATIENMRTQLENDRNIKRYTANLELAEAEELVEENKFRYLEAKRNELLRQAATAKANRQGALRSLQNNVNVELDSIKFIRNEKKQITAIRALELEQEIFLKCDITGSFFTKFLKNSFLIPFEILATTAALLTGIGEVPYRVEELVSGRYLYNKLPPSARLRIDQLTTKLNTLATDLAQIPVNLRDASEIALSRRLDAASDAWKTITNDATMTSFTPLTTNVETSSGGTLDSIRNGIRNVGESIVNLIGKNRFSPKKLPSVKYGTAFRNPMFRGKGSVASATLKPSRPDRIGGRRKFGSKFSGSGLTAGLRRTFATGGKNASTIISLVPGALGPTKTARFFGGLGIGMEVAGAAIAAWQGGAFTEGETLGF